MAVPLVSTALIQDLLVEVDPGLYTEPPAFTRALTTFLRPSLNQVIKTLRTPEKMELVIVRQRRRLTIFPTTEKAFELFVNNMENGD